MQTTLFIFMEKSNAGANDIERGQISSEIQIKFSGQSYKGNLVS